MKSELRHELKSNLLADRLEEFVLAIKPYLKVIGFSLAAAVVAGLAYGLVHARNEKASASAWSELYFAANRAESLDEVYQDFPTTSAGLWARQKSADALMSRALEQVYVDRDLSDKLLEEAAQAYRSVLAKAQEPMLVCRATYGLAQVLDSQGDASSAAREFKKVLTLPGAHSDMIADAQRRLEFIESDDGRGFYEWFKNNRPTAPKPVDLPKDLGSLPSQPDLQFSSPLPSTPVLPPNEATPGTGSAPESDLKMPPADKSASEVKEPVPQDSPKIVEPPIAKPDAEPASKPPALEPPADEPSAVESKSEAIEIPDVDSSPSEKKAGGS